jgi:hypothetical protein
MRKLVLFSLFSLSAFSVAAQQQSQPPKQQKQAAPAAKKDAKEDNKDAKEENNLERRLRTEGAAGGTAPVPREQREGVGAGAKPHMHDDRLDRGLHRRSQDEVIEPAK